MIDCEPFPGAAEAAHDFVADEEDAVAVADLAESLEISVRRNDQAIGAGHRLDENRRDGVATFVREDLLDLGETSRGECRVAVALAIEMTAVFVWIEKTNDAGDAGLVR